MFQKKDSKWQPAPTIPAMNASASKTTMSSLPQLKSISKHGQGGLIYIKKREKAMHKKA
jgi:hypothetical protein